jgi:putative Holliday junction resolvase
LRTLALDVGEKRIGVAISSPEGRLGIPLQTLERQSESADLAAIQALVEAEAIGTIVVGMPISLSGDRGEQAARTEAFVALLKTAVTVPVLVWDERLSSVEAQRRISEASTRRSRRARPADRGRVDALAAAIILQSYLDSQQTR